MMGTAAPHTLALLVLVHLSQAAPEAGLSPEALEALRDSVPAQQRQRATTLLQQAEELQKAGDWERAVELLMEATGVDPSFARPHTVLGWVHELQYVTATDDDTRRRHQTSAITAYAGALAIAPEDEYSRAHISSLFFGAQFPRALDVTVLGHTPVQFVVSNARLTGIGDAGTPVKRGWAYTGSAIFPRQRQGREGIEVWPQDPRGLGRYNRVCYGYTADAESRRLQRRFNVYHPSTGLAHPVIDHTPLAHRVASSLLRLRCYAAAYLGDSAPASDDEAVPVWLSDRGDPGGEQMQDSILLYDIAENRESIEWLREVAHEYGHLVFPRIGYFEPFDEDASGLIGERLFMRWLAEDALSATGATWPSAGAQRAFDALWTKPLAMGEFLISRCDAPMHFWLQEGPQSDHLGAETREAAEYFVGFVLYVESAHGRPILADLLGHARGGSAAEFVKTYEERMAAHLDRTGLALDAAVFIPEDSTLHSPAYRTLADAPGALFAPDEHATYRLYLPTGRWHVRLEQEGQRPASFAVSLDGEYEQGLVLGADADAQGVVFSTATPGWHALRIKLVNADEPVRLRRAHITATKPTPETERETPVADPNPGPSVRVPPGPDIPIPDVPVPDGPTDGQENAPAP